MTLSLDHDFDHPEYKVGKRVWVHNGGEGNPLVKGEIVAILHIDGYNKFHYIVELPSSIAPILIVRDWHTVSEGKNKDINFWEMIKKRKNPYAKD